MPKRSASDVVQDANPGPKRARILSREESIQQAIYDLVVTKHEADHAIQREEIDVTIQMHVRMSPNGQWALGCIEDNSQDGYDWRYLDLFDVADWPRSVPRCVDGCEYESEEFSFGWCHDEPATLELMDSRGSRCHEERYVLAARHLTVSALLFLSSLPAVLARLVGSYVVDTLDEACNVLNQVVDSTEEYECLE